MINEIHEERQRPYWGTAHGFEKLMAYTALVGLAIGISFVGTDIHLKKAHENRIRYKSPQIEIENRLINNQLFINDGGNDTAIVRLNQNHNPNYTG